MIDLSESYHTRVSASKELKEAQAHLVGIFQSYGLNVTTHHYVDAYADNICADLVGEENPDLIVIAGAHYDSRSTSSSDTSLRAPGAVDNGSGTAGMVEMARVLAMSGVRFSNTVRFCLWSGEEQGLLGSEAYARKMEGEGADIVAYFNADMTGYRLPLSRIIMGMKDSSVTGWLLTLSFQITEMYVPTLPVDYSSSCCSDYISFYNHGYPSIGYFQNPATASDYPDYHKVFFFAFFFLCVCVFVCGCHFSLFSLFFHSPLIPMTTMIMSKCALRPRRCWLLSWFTLFPLESSPGQAAVVFFFVIVVCFGFSIRRLSLKQDT